uniref:small serum protein 2-like n=1 Tax=Euleptes europaea TaxID=460621 RepID=UPI0025424E92|nr:small serum protein 2-like [Euleptes europaea]
MELHKVLLSLTILCIAVSLSNGACFHDLPKHGIKDGCLDPYNKEKHPFGSKWNSDKCMTCTCDRTILSCCTRYTSEPHVQGCKAVLDKRTCKYKHYKVDNPSELCF